MRKNKEKNNKKILISIIVILILIVFILLAILNNKKKDRPTAIMGIYDKTQEEVPSLKYTNLSEIALITEDPNEEINIAKKFRNIFENDISKLKKDIENLNTEKIEAYYDENQKEIKENFYYIEKEDFKSLCNKLKEMNSNLEQDFDICDFKATKNDKIEVTCTYKNGENITFLLSANKKLEFK